jgi:hypothetical protein
VLQLSGYPSVRISHAGRPGEEIKSFRASKPLRSGRRPQRVIASRDPSLDRRLSRRRLSRWRFCPDWPKPAATGTANAKTGWRTKNIISAGNIRVANAIAHSATNKCRQNSRFLNNIVQDIKTKKCTAVDKKPTESSMTVVSPADAVYKTRTGMKTAKVCSSQ